MNLKKFAIVLMVFFCHFTLIAQESFLLSGTISSESDQLTLPGVNVIVKGTNRGVVSDFDGNYEIDVVKGDVLQFTFLGFNTEEIIINEQKILNVSMSVDAQQLDETVVIGYGTRKKSHLTGAVSSVVNEDLDQLPVARIDDALVGQISGVNIQATQGEAGSAPTIRIRGTGSLTGSSDPLIVVDGLVVDNDFLGSLDMSEVESFDVLKDAASAAIYGSRGSNGVILITTKQGKEGKTVFSYQTYMGFKEARESDAYYFSVAKTAAAELAATGQLSNRTQYIQKIGIDRDYQDIIFDGGIIENHSLSARGGTEKTKFSISMGYLHDEGVLLTDDYKRYNLRLKLDTKVSDKFKMGGNLAPSYTNTRRFDGSTHDILRQSPWLPVYHDENSIQYVDRNVYPDVQIGDYAIQRHFDNYDLFGDGTLIDISDTSNTNPVAKVVERDRNDLKLKLYGNFYGEYKILDDLSIRANLSGDYQNTFRDRWQGVLSSRNGASDASYEVSNENRIHVASETYLSYDTTIGDHEIDALVGISFEKWDYEGSSSLGTGYSSDLIKTLSAATVATDIGSFIYSERFQSYFARVNYAYADKYLASVSFRRDGSSIFGAESKYGDFPAVSVGWDIAQEDFLRENNYVSNLKFRLSYGFTGNKDLDTNSDIIDLYPSLPLLGPASATIGGGLESAFIALNIANPDLKWERSKEINPGLDFGFFKNRLTGSVDYYKRTSDQLLLFNPVSSTTGFRNALVNIGEVVNSGLELELRTRNISTSKFKWSTTILGSMNDNELTDFADSNGQIQIVDDKRAAEWINLQGQPISSFYGWVVDEQIALENLQQPFFPIGAQAQDVYVKDLNGDGVIDDDDKTILGNPYPDLLWSLTNDFKIGNVDVSFLFQGSHGAEVRNMGDQYIFNHFNSGQDFVPATTPNQGFIKEKIFTNSVIQDASYVALRNVNIGYNLPENLTSKIGLTGLRIYAAGQNLKYWTADNYTGFNPESIDDTSATTYGYQRGGSPIYKTISIGLNADF
ncbi:TonB-linked SusC/RagA family outer membrane protein [Gillisia mitskevichiae]|uniref:TonB-linked SusC/RagA family outer membrane protein n=1 Tax=Gillisia mitskevichiae TaxID=270921 RepID=A0A495PXU4_9FLAO|nr:TonB-dependent receptor [Gillisia mitskevichiae]RKS55708.1 TonB-linked SusC/RagA family outer membrane protein [Gillisia mitskevichiae]